MAVGFVVFSVGCRTPVVYEGLGNTGAGLDIFGSPVSDAEVTGLIQHHAQAAVAASESGRLDDARAHLEAHRSLRALVVGKVDIGVDPKVLDRLSDLLQGDEVEAEQGAASEPRSPDGLQRVKSVDLGASAAVVKAPETNGSLPRSVRTTAPPAAVAALRPTGGARPASTGALPTAPRSATDASPPLPADWLPGEVRRILAEFGEDRAVALPPAFLKDVENAVREFAVGGRRSWFARALRRMDKYLPAIHGIFSARRLPESFYYLALVESGFDPNARSRVGAVGLWQFMPATARHYGLSVRRGLDERRDPKKATRAAREYLLDLVLEFGDGHSMLLAMAAYNAGEGRVRHRLRQLRDYRDRSFWALAERKLLPLETRRYVPKVIAAAVVGRNRARFGHRATRPNGSVATVELRRPVSIPYLLQAAKMAEASLLALNPDLEGRNGVTPADTRFQLVLPAEVASRLETDPVLLAARKPPAPVVAAPDLAPKRVAPDRPSSRDRYIAHRVMRNDTWWSISRWSGVSHSKLRNDNPSVAKSGLRVGQVVYVRGIDARLRRIYHTVESDETVDAIAQQYRVKAGQIEQWNGLTSRTLKAGQRLVIYTRRPAPDPAPPADPNGAPNPAPPRGARTVAAG